MALPAPSPPIVQGDRLEPAVAALTASNTSLRTVIVDLQAEISRLGREVTRLQSATAPVLLPITRSHRDIAPPTEARTGRTRVGMFTVAELERLGSKSLLRLDAHMRALAQIDTGFNTQFTRRMEMMGLRGLPEYRTMTEAQIEARRDIQSNTVAERSYWWALRHTVDHQESGGNSWVADCIFYRFTIKEYFEWRGINEAWTE